MASFVFKNFLHSFGIELTNFWQLFAISSSWYQTEIMASISLLTVFDFSLFLIIPHKFSTGFKCGEFPGHSKNRYSIFLRHFLHFFSRMATCQIMLEYAPTISKCNLHVSYNLMIDYIDVLVGIHYSRAGIEWSQTTEAKRPQNIFFWGCLTVWLMCRSVTFSLHSSLHNVCVVPGPTNGFHRKTILFSIRFQSNGCISLPTLLVFFLLHLSKAAFWRVF